MYLSFNDYAEMGGLIEDDIIYARLEAKARSHVDRLTFGRLIGAEIISEAVRYCMYDLIAALAADENLGGISAGRDIASMNNDGVSVSFASSGGKSANTRYAAIIRAWLASETALGGIPLLYAGVCAV